MNSSDPIVVQLIDLIIGSDSFEKAIICESFKEWRSPIV